MDLTSWLSTKYHIPYHLCCFFGSYIFFSNDFTGVMDVLGAHGKWGTHGWVVVSASLTHSFLLIWVGVSPLSIGLSCFVVSCGSVLERPCLIFLVFRGDRV